MAASKEAASGTTCGDDTGSGRLAAWWAGWHGALRLARRDIAKHRGRSLLIVLLVGIPVLLICAGATAFATDDVNAVEALPRLMGRSQALVSLPNPTGVGDQRVHQGPDPLRGSVYTDGKAVRGPGVAPDAPWTTRRVERLTGGSVLRTATAMTRARLGDRHVDLKALFVDGGQPVTTGMTSLVSGRWSRSTHEVVVTAKGIAAGVPRSGTFTIDPGNTKPVTVTVVGVGTAWLTGTQHADLIALPSALAAWHGDPDQTAFLVARRDPITWAEVKRLNTYGLLVSSRQVISHPQQAESDPDGPKDSIDDPVVTGVVVLLAVGILLETMLLAGPAFAVSAARQRRSLALIASNGANGTQIRRYVLAQAVLLGALAAVVGAGVGVAVGLLGIRWWASSQYAVNSPGPVDVPVWEVLGVAACAALASLVAAYLPARGAGRLDLVTVLRGRGVTARPVRRGQPVLGLALAGVGGVVLVLSIANHGHEAEIAVCAVVLVAGALLLIPWMLSMVGRLGGRLPLPLRMATRDIGRQRGRSAPAVAAIMVAVTALTALAIANASDQAQAARDYRPTTVLGQGLVSGGGAGWPADAVATVHRNASDLGIMPIRRIGVSDWVDPDATEDGVKVEKTTAVRVQRIGCAERSARSDREHAQGVDEFGPIRKCSAIGADANFSDHDRLGVVDPSMARARLGLTDAQVDLLTRGGMLVMAGSHSVSDGRVTVLTGSRKVDSYGYPMGRIHPTRVQRLPAATVKAAQLDRFGLFGSTGALVTPATARAHHWTTYVAALSLRDPAGAISKDTERAVSQHLSDNALLRVEHGYQSDLWVLYLVLFGVFGTLVVVATLISTALAQAESRADLGTLAAVGATRRLRRAIAGSQAFAVGLTGSLLGLAIGFVPGVALTWPLTVEPTGSYNPSTGITTTTAADAAASLPGPVIDIPWSALAVVVIGVPLVAALLAASGIRKSPQITRRLG